MAKNPMRVEITVWDVDGAEYHCRINDPDVGGGGLGGVIAACIVGVDMPRVCEVVSSIVVSLRDREQFEGVPQHWDGYQEALESLCAGADAIVNGWDKHDKAWNLTPTPQGAK